jgi:alkanesulfonate monooxygenase SsuD/methylene tetrahydromethanopterin reductase-like flavin-dependent oxidoreductase (luciferase family)
MLPVHDPAVLAGDIALVDHLTQGRLEIGPGRGGAPYEFDRMKRPSDFESLRDIYEEKFTLLRKLLTETNVTFEGKYCNADNATIMPPVLQKPYPPIWQTCQREEAAFHSAKNGYHVFTSSLRRPMSYVQGLLDAFREGVKESSKPQGEPEFAHLQWVYVAKNEADAREKLEIAFIKQQKFWGIFHNTLTVTDGLIPPVEMDVTLEELEKGLIIGTRDYVEDRLLEIKEMGVDLMVMKTGFGASNADELAGLDRFAEFIQPKLK